MYRASGFSRTVVLAAAAALSWSAATASAATLYSKTYTNGQPATQGGTYFRARANVPSFTNDEIKFTNNGQIALLYDQGFSTTLANFTIKATHVASNLGTSHGILPLAIHHGDSTDYAKPGISAPSGTEHPIGGFGAWAVNTNVSQTNSWTGPHDLRFGVVSDITNPDGTNPAGQSISQERPTNNQNGIIKDFFLAANQVSGDGVSNMDPTGRYDLTIDVVVVGSSWASNATTYNTIDDPTARTGNKFVYTFEQQVGGVTNTWSKTLTFQEILGTIAGNNGAWRRFQFLADLAYQPDTAVGFAFFNNTNTSPNAAMHSTWDDLTVTGIPEPASLGLLAVSSLWLLTRRQRRD